MSLFCTPVADMTVNASDQQIDFVLFAATK
jgi:hypothetical protein